MFDKSAGLIFQKGMWMRLRDLLCAVIVGTAAYLTPQAVLCAQPDMSAPARVAERWLSLVDAGAFEQAFETGSNGLKLLTDKQYWRQSLMDARGKLGSIVYRKLKDQRALEHVSGLPEGDYVTIEYETRFDGNEIRHERVVLEAEEEGTWRVARYSILKPAE